ncbi:MAG: UDP-4-amino-4,6-dideoxy-N-acetyl-beta-L-altrosamine N-acetyltransferase [Planctomycetes bacterium]|nr:UDP-4-amino-4,6-dideoxy-N-acetyl-beta-L-altrosamine N-acetyltransferase [Planctomycetota bacterium]
MFTFTIPREADAKTILEWRIKPRITQFMLTDVEYDLEKQKAWLTSVRSQSDNMHWIINISARKIGLIYLTDINRQDKRCYWGFYVGEDAYLGIGGMIPPYLYNFVFFEMRMETLMGEVLSGNERLIDLHKYHGYRYLECRSKDTIKNGISYDVHVMELTREAWRSKTRFHKYRAVFPLPDAQSHHQGNGLRLGEAFQERRNGKLP